MDKQNNQWFTSLQDLRNREKKRKFLRKALEARNWVAKLARKKVAY